MSFYNMIHGENPFSDILLGVLGLTKTDIPRYRDCYWTGTQIAVHTRTGGGNRDYYEHEEACRENYPEYFTGDDKPKGPWNSDLRAIKTFVRDEDDDYDSTYATFYFNVPDDFAWVIPHLQAADATPSQRWESFMDKMRASDTSDPQVARVLNVMSPLFEKITTALSAKRREDQ